MLDIEGRHRDIRRIVASTSIFRRGVATGHDADDMMQVVMLGLITRQLGRSVYDPSRSSLSRYVNVVTASVLANYLDSQRRRDVHEQVGTLDAALSHRGVTAPIDTDAPEALARQVATLPVADQAIAAALVSDGLAAVLRAHRRDPGPVQRVAQALRQHLTGRVE